MASSGREEMFFKIAVFLAVITFIGGVLNLANAGQISLENLATPDGTVPGMINAYSNFGAGTSGGQYYEGSNSANGSVITDLDFTTSGAVNQNVTTLVGGTWTLTSGVGMVLTSTPFFAGTLNPSAVILRNAMSSGGAYSFNAIVDNIPGGDFYVYPRFIDGYSGSDLKVVFSSDGIHVKKFPLSFGFFDAGDDYFYPMTGARNTLSGGSRISTILNETISSSASNIPDYTSTLSVYKDNVLMFTIPARSILPGYNINDQVRHGGAGSDTTSFTIKSFPGISAKDTAETIISGGINSGTEQSDDWGTAIAKFLGNLVAGFWQIVALLAVFFGISGSALMPWWLWLIIGSPCLATLALIQIQIWRGN